MLLRKIASKKRWDVTEVSKQISRKHALFLGDAIADLRTKENTISVWYTPNLDIDNTKDVLAVMAVNCDKLDKVVYVALDEQQLKNRGINFKIVEGDCDAINNINILQRHRDIIEVDYWHLGLLAEYIYELVEKNEVYTTKASDVKSYIKDLIATNDLDVDKLDDKKRVALGYQPLSPCYNCTIKV